MSLKYCKILWNGLQLEKGEKTKNVVKIVEGMQKLNMWERAYSR